MKNKVIYPLFIIAVLSFVSGCYTMVEHPDVVTKDENGYTYTEEVYFYDDCSSCHKQMPSRKYIAADKLKMAKTHRETDQNNQVSDNRDNGNRTRSDYYYDGYYEDSYYSSPYYGDYGYYYAYPWWYSVTPVVNSSEKDRKTAAESRPARNNDGGRGNEGRGSDNGRSRNVDVSSPTVNTGSSSGTSGGSSGGDSKKSSDNGGSRTSSDSSSKDNDRRSSSGNSSTRDNDGGRGSSGRR